MDYNRVHRENVSRNARETLLKRCVSMYVHFDTETITNRPENNRYQGITKREQYVAP